MSTVYFSNGETAEVEDVRGHDPRTFTVPSISYSTVANAWTAGATAKFTEDGENYLLKQLRGNQAIAVPEVTRARR